MNKKGIRKLYPNRKIKVAKNGMTKDGKVSKVEPHSRRRPRDNKNKIRSATSPHRVRKLSGIMNPSELKDKFLPQLAQEIEEVKSRFEKDGKPIIKKAVEKEAAKILLFDIVGVNFPIVLVEEAIHLMLKEY